MNDEHRNGDEHAEYELNLLLKMCDDDKKPHQEELNRKVLDLVNAFGDQGHSGFSAGMTIGTFKRYAKMSRDEVWGRLEKAIDLCDSDDGREMQELFNEDVKKLLDIFYGQNNTEEDADAIIDMFCKLADFKPVAPLTGEDWEWGQPYSMDGNRQNKRCSAVFKDKNGVATYLYKYVFSDNGGHSWFTAGHIEDDFGLDRTIKFPYTPKSEYIYVKGDTEKDCGFVNITGNQEEIDRLYKEFEERYK